MYQLEIAFNALDFDWGMFLYLWQANETVFTVMRHYPSFFIHLPVCRLHLTLNVLMLHVVICFAFDTLLGTIEVINSYTAQKELA